MMVHKDNGCSPKWGSLKPCWRSRRSRLEKHILKSLCSVADNHFECLKSDSLKWKKLIWKWFDCAISIPNLHPGLRIHLPLINWQNSAILNLQKMHTGNSKKPLPKHKTHKTHQQQPHTVIMWWMVRSVIDKEKKNQRSRKDAGLSVHLQLNMNTFALSATRMTSACRDYITYQMRLSNCKSYLKVSAEKQDWGQQLSRSRAVTKPGDLMAHLGIATISHMQQHQVLFRIQGYVTY